MSINKITNIKNTKKKKYGSLAWRLSAILILSSLLTFVLVSHLALVGTKEILVQKTYNQLDAVSDLHSNQFFNRVHGLENDLVVLSKSNQLTNYLDQNLLNQNQNNENIIIEDSKAVDELRSYILSFNFQQQLMKRYYFFEMSLLDASGNVVLSTNDKRVGDNDSSENYFQNAQKDSYIDKVRYFEKNNQHVLNISVPIIENGKMKGMLSGSVELAILYNIEQSGDIYVNLMDLDGHILNDTNQRLRQVSSPGFDKAVDGYFGVAQYLNHENEQVVGNYKSFPELGLVLLSEIPVNIVFAPWYEFFNLAMIYLLVILSVTIIFSILFGNFISRPLRKLSLISQQIAAGDFSQKAVVNSNTEIGALSDAFNQMTSKLIDLTKKQKDLIKRRTAQLENANKKNKAILSSIGDGVVATDHNGNIILFNHMSEKLLGYDVDDVINKKQIDYLKLYTKQDDDLYLNVKSNYLSSVLKKNKNYKASIVDSLYCHSAKNRYFPIRITITPIAQDKTTIGALTVFTDITAEKNIDNMKSEFISVISHQMRTPLTSIKWFIEMLLDGEKGKLSAGQKDYLQQIFESDMRMIMLVNNLLSAAKLESGNINFNKKMVSVINLIEGVVRESKPLAMSKNIKIDFHILSSDIDFIDTDSVKFRQVIQNLLSNAIKYNQKNRGGTIDIKLGKFNCKEIKNGVKHKKISIWKVADLLKKVYKHACENYNSKDDILFIAVANTGVGIPIDTQNQIFQKFYRGCNVKKIDTDGTGLGLYITKTLITGMGGNIWFESEENQGAIFYLTIPVKSSNKK